MFYFASDNPLAPSVVSQLKAIKEAGFHPRANVIAQFDPHTENTPTHLFEVNLVNRLKAGNRPSVGFRRNDPFVRNLVDDKLWDRSEMSVRTSIANDFNKMLRHSNGRHARYDPPIPTRPMAGEQNPMDSLRRFLGFCREHYPARHYILFIVGHGVVVGNDIFLLDENAPESSFKARTAKPAKAKEGGNFEQGQRRSQKDAIPAQHSLLLKDLGKVLTEFTALIKKEGSEFELIGFHSCSMSSLEVAYELRKTARYMLASQGPAFVGSWPYRQILIRIFNDLVEAKLNLKDTLRKIFDYCVLNSYDFQLAGYSFDLCLCDLTKATISDAIKNLVEALNRGLDDDVARSLVLLAHLEAQSYWQENYTDLLDFCFCLSRRCGLNPEPGVLADIVTACGEVIEALKVGDGWGEGQLILNSEYVGPDFQYSHGLSVFFPWSRPADKFFDTQYKTYSYATETNWAEFLETYFDKTMRKVHIEEQCPAKEYPGKGSREQVLLGLIQDVSSKVFNTDGQLSKGGSGDKTGGDDCECPSVKNYPSITRERDGRHGAKFPISRSLAIRLGRKITK